MSAPGSRSARPVIAVAVAVVLAVTLPPQASADEQPRRSKVRESAEAQVSCRFDQVGERVYVSAAGGRREAVGHGWWTNRRCPGDMVGKVTVTIEAKLDGEWRTVGHEETVRDRAGGPVKRARACAFCAGRKVTEWRSVIDVDIEDHPDSREPFYTPAVRRQCGARA